MAVLLYLQHANDASDEIVVNTWLENPYWPFFTGETYIQTELPIDPSSLTRGRQHIGEEGVELLLAVTIEAARTVGMSAPKIQAAEDLAAPEHRLTSVSNSAGHRQRCCRGVCRCYQPRKRVVQTFHGTEDEMSIELPTRGTSGCLIA